MTVRRVWQEDVGDSVVRGARMTDAMAKQCDRRTKAAHDREHSQLGTRATTDCLRPFPKIVLQPQGEVFCSNSAVMEVVGQAGNHDGASCCVGK